MGAMEGSSSFLITSNVTEFQITGNSTVQYPVKINKKERLIYCLSLVCL